MSSKLQKSKSSPPQHPPPENNRLGNAVAVQQHYSGPIPPPDLLEHYEHLAPGSIERIFQMAELDLAHKRSSETTIIINQSVIENNRHNEVMRGQNYAMVATIIAFASTIVAIIYGFEKVAIAIGPTTVIGLVTAFIKGRKE